MRTTLSLAAFIVLTVCMSSCSKDDNFNTGWQATLESNITLSTDSVNDISLGFIDLEETAMNYLDEFEAGYESFRIIEVTPSTGSLVTTNIVPLDFLDELDIYAVADGEETMIGMTIMNTDPSNASRSIDFLDINLDDLADSDGRVEIVLKPIYVAGTSASDVATEISMTFNFQVSGRK